MKISDIIIDKPIGFAGLINNVMGSLNDNAKFQETFRKTQCKFLLNASNLNYAALITIDRGNLIIQSVPNKPKSNLNKKNIKWDGFISMDSQTFLAFAMKRLSLIKLALKWISGDVKLKGLFKVLPLLKIFHILTEY